MRSIAKALVGLLWVAVLAACAGVGSPALTSPPAGATVVSPTETTRPTIEPTARPTSQFSLTMADTGRTITVPVASEVDVTLQTIGPAEYGNPQLSSPSVRFLSVSYVTPPVPAGPTQLFRFEAAAQGQTTITIQSTGHSPEFEVTVNSD